MEISFVEKQKFRQVWVWVILLSVVVASAIGGYVFIQQKQYINGYFPLIPMVLVPVLLVWFMLVIKLKTRIDASGIYYQLFPIHLNENKILWEDVSNIYVRKYSPIMEYGGWGIRYSIRNGKAYNIAGNQGIQIILKNKKKILLGTQKPQEAATMLAQLFKDGSRPGYTDEQITSNDRF